MTIPLQYWEAMYIHTFIISTMVFKAIKVMTKYSNFVDTTSFQILYLIVFLFFGMYRLVGRAFTAKSIHCFCYKRKKTPSFQTFSSQRDQSFPNCAFIFYKNILQDFKYGNVMLSNLYILHVYMPLNL